MLITVKNIKALLISGLKRKKIIHNFQKMWIITIKKVKRKKINKLCPIQTALKLGI